MTLEQSIGPLTNLIVERDGGVITVTIDCPPVNAINSATLAEIALVFGQISADPDSRAVVLTAAGDRAFVAGADLREVRQRAADEPALSDPGLPSREALEAIWNCAVPVIVAVNGPAIGGGISIVSMCDIILATPEAWFAAPEINVGLLGGGAHLARLVGTHQARRMYLTGEKISAEVLHNQGVIARLVARDRLVEAARSIAADLAKKSPLAMRLAKEALIRIDAMPVLPAYRLEQDYTTRLLTFEDSAEARAAFLEKRPPHWKMR